MIGDHLASYDYAYLLKLGLSDLPSTVDQRQGGVVYDAISGMAKQLSLGFLVMRGIYQDTFAEYAIGEPLALRAVENGVTPKKASKAIRKGIFIGNDDLPYPVPLGARFSTVAGSQSINYKVIEQIAVGVYQLEAETIGTVGNDYVGQLLPLDVIYNLKSAEMTDLIIPASNDETDDSLRIRYFEEKNSKKFGGNITQYRSWVVDQDGIGACQVYPIWAGGGSVKVSAVDSHYSPLSVEALDRLQQLLDPTKDGQGLGTAPIGHIVTVVTPEVLLIDLSATLQIGAGFHIDQLKPLIVEQVTAYIDEAKVDWGQPASADDNDYSLYIFRSQVMAAILRVKGVLNIVSLTLNGQEGDISLTQTPQLQQLPQLGVVDFV